jgi:tRNA(Arg) A34 adenosine deaminase TadA
MTGKETSNAMMKAMIPFMELAIEQARKSLKEGNSGFGAVVVHNGEVLAVARDTEKTRQDPTAHAEITAIRESAATLGHDLTGCTIISTHEPCPMCAAAILWSGITNVVYGVSIHEALEQGRKRIDLPCRELFERSGRAVNIIPGVMREECAVLYNRHVRKCIAELRGLDDQQAALLTERLSQKRLSWYDTQKNNGNLYRGPLLEEAYRLFLAKLSISEEEAPIVSRKPKRLVIHSRNFCPTLEACKILGLDTCRVCAQITEAPMDRLLKQLDPRLGFSRNYNAIRPNTHYCEEFISLLD